MKKQLLSFPIMKISFVLNLGSFYKAVQKELVLGSNASKPVSSSSSLKISFETLTKFIILR